MFNQYNKTMTTKVLSTNFVNIVNNNIKIEFFIKAIGQSVKCFVAINDKTYTSVNYCNYKNDPEFELNFITQELKDGTYKLFV